jgi:hypothetical protein
MGWLRRQQDIASLFAVWALLLQALLGPIGMATHAAAATSLAGGIICTTRGPVSGLGTSIPKPNRQQNDCPGCSHACRTACSFSSFAIASGSATPLPFQAYGAVAGRHGGDYFVSADSQSEFCSRAPPILG